MGEYQYYEFQAIDRPLTDDEQAAVARLSSRVQPHPWRAAFVYHWSNLPCDPADLLVKYYDALLYLANWGSRRLMFRFPRAALDVEAVQAYCQPPIVWDGFSLSTAGDYAVLNVQVQAEWRGDWAVGEAWLPGLIGLRRDILHDDHRALYLAWLKLVEVEEVHDSVVEPPVPAGLRRLTSSLRSFIRLFGIDPYLVRAAARASDDLCAPPGDWLRAAVGALPEEERLAFLVRLARGEAYLAPVLARRLRRAAGPTEMQGRTRRTVGELRQAARQIRRRAEERRARESAEQYQREMDELAEYEGIHWAEIERLIEQKNARSYDGAVALLVKLRELARYQGENVAFAERVGRLRDKYAKRPALQQRLERAGLVQT